MAKKAQQKSDLTKALEERRKAKSQSSKTLELLGEEFKLPRSLPASVAMMLMELRGLADDQGEAKNDERALEILFDVGKTLFGEQQWKRLLDLIEMDELNDVLTHVVNEINPAGAPTQQESGDDAGEG